MDDPVPHYFSERPDVGSATRTIDVALPDIAFTLVTDRGVFSHGRLDAGTSLLLREAPPMSPVGNLLDLGCGAGAIAVAMALRAPAATVWAVDVNERARALTAANAARNRVSNVRATVPDDVPDDVRFDTIWSNPPIRVGKEALHALLEHWLSRLALGGTAILVVQKHLGADSLQHWLNDHGHPTERLTSRAGYRLLQVSRKEDRSGSAGRVDGDA